MEQRPLLQELTTNLTIRLINNTRLLLPITGCQTISANRNDIFQGAGESWDACSVDWSRAQLLLQVEAERDASRVSSHQDYNTSPLLEAQPTRHQWLRLSYLSLNSTLAVCGLLANLFIILILLFNLRQRRRATGSNMAAKNNLLLFQLTLTGLLLGAYMLADNMNTCSLINHYAGLKSGHLCAQPEALAALPAPLLTFLPRTYFHWREAIEDLRDQQSSISSDTDSPVIVLKYLTNISLTEMPLNRDADSSRYIDLQVSQEEEEEEEEGEAPERVRLRRFDLSNEDLHTSTALLHCDKPNQHSSSLAGAQLMLAMGSLPLLVNIVASAHIWTVAALAYDRYRAIAHPFQYLRSVHTSRTKTFFALSWLVLLSLNLVLPISLHQDENSPAAGSMTHWYRWLVESVVSIYRRSSQLNADNACHLRSFAELGTRNQAQSIGWAHTLARHLASLLDVAGSASVRPRVSLNDEMYVIMLIVLSFMGFLAVVLLPLIIITVCNIGIYRIVKVHERRLSFSSSTTVAASNSTLQQQQQQQQHNQHLSAGSNKHQLDHHLTGGRREIPGLDKRPLVPLISRIMGARRRSAGKGRLRTPLSEPAAGSGGARSPDESCRKRGSSSNESASSDTGSQVVVRGGARPSCGDIGSDARYQAPPEVGAAKEAGLMSHADSGASSIYRFLSSVSGRPHSGTGPHRCLPVRKSSDSGLVMAAPVSEHPVADGTQPQHMSDTDLAGDSPSLSNSPSCLFRERNSSGSILNQLKLAGLSFAGIAIQQPLATGSQAGSRRAIHKSSSTYSFGGSQSNLNWSHRQHSYADQSPSYRGSYDSSFAGPVPTKRSYVSLNGSLKQYDDFSTAKYKTKLLEEPAAPAAVAYAPTPTQSASRLTLSFGTKSAIFNVLVWLIMTLLLITLPHYLFSVMRPITRLSFLTNTLQQSGLMDVDRRQSVCEISKLFTGNSSQDLSLLSSKHCQRSAEATQSVESYLSALIVDSITICLACLCRLLFLIIIPLNGCLYGFSSRSFRTAIKMILKRYISKKQASIEINQRHRPLSAIHQRASSCSNFASMMHECQPQEQCSTKKELQEEEARSFSWKFMKIFKFKWASGKDAKSQKGALRTPQISLDDSFCQSESQLTTTDTCNQLNMLGNSVNSSFSLACSVVDLQDLHYSRVPPTSGFHHKKHPKLHRARAASLSSFAIGHQVSLCKRKSPGHAPVRSHNHFRSKSVDQGQGSFLSGCVVGRINKHRAQPRCASKLGSRCSLPETGTLGNARTLKSATDNGTTDSAFQRLLKGLSALFNGDILGHRFKSKSHSSQQQAENQCKVALLSRNSPGSQREPTQWKPSDSQWLSRNLSGSPTVDSMASVTSSSVVGAGCCVIRPPVHHNSREHATKGTSEPQNAMQTGQSQDKNPLYLKPPSFLKLSLDTGGHINHTYRITSTLSPIRESSSNHSYASSQSSLANPNHRAQSWLAALQDTTNDQATHSPR